MSKQATELTALLIRMRRGDAEAGERAMNSVYAEIHKIARRYMASERRDQTLQPTALVNEAYLRLMTGPENINDRNHFFALAARAMRHVLIDHARKKQTDKRGGGAIHLELNEQDVAAGNGFEVDVLALDSALERLSKLDPKAAEIIELRFFGGHTDQEVCAILGENLSAVRRQWEFGRAWLRHDLSSERS